MTPGISHRLPEALLLGAVIFGPCAFGAVEPWSFAILSILIFTVVFFLALLGAVPATSAHRGVLCSMALLLAIGVAQRLNPASPLEPSSLWPSTVSVYATDRALWTWLAYLSVIWCASRVFVDEASVRRLLATIFALGCFIAVVGIVQQSQDRLLMYGVRHVPYGYEPFGPYYNRDHAASMLVMAGFCGVGLLFDRFSKRTRGGTRTNVYNFASVQTLILFGIGVILIAVVETLSRGGLAAALLSGAALAAASAGRARSRVRVVAAFVTAAALLVFLSPIAARLDRAYVQGSVLFRLSLYGAGVEQFRDFPWFGVGLGAFQQAYYQYQPLAIRGIVEHVHSDWLQMLLQAGSVGFVVYIIALALYLRRSVGALSTRAGDSASGMSGGVFAAIGAFLLHGLLDFSFQIPANAVIFLVLLAALGTLASGPVAASTRARPQCLVAGVAIVLSVLSARPALASWFELRRSPDSVESGLAAFRGASEWDRNPKYYFELARLQAQSAGKIPGPRVSTLREALSSSSIALDRHPLDPRYRELQAELLRRMGRAADADEYSAK